MFSASHVQRMVRLREEGFKWNKKKRCWEKNGKFYQYSEQLNKMIEYTPR